jgi:biotin-(acetyl-CoA carboxylase) ligase
MDAAASNVRGYPIWEALWLSAVVPLSHNDAARKVLPLAAGLAVCDGLHELGFRSTPALANDVLVNDRKLAGLLIDQFVPGLAVVGIGLNVTNQPEACASHSWHIERLVWRI